MTFFLGSLMVVANLKDAGTFTHVNKMLGSAARVTEAAGNAATVLLDKSALLAETTTAGVEVFSSSSMSVAKAAWSGVDLVGMRASKFSFYIEARSIQSLHMWLLSNDSHTLFGGSSAGCTGPMDGGSVIPGLVYPPCCAWKG